MDRKLVAILAGDVVGFSRLVGAHETDTVENVQACFEFIAECVSDHNGRVFNSAGDSVLSEFRSVVDAVRCALEVQEFLDEVNDGMVADRQILMRFGVHLGDVIVDNGNLLGDGVNIAARVEGLANPGGICVTSSVYQNVGGRIEGEFEDIGEPDLKNIDGPVRVYRLHRPGAMVHPEPAVPLQQPEAASEAPAIAVLPFDNLSSDPHDEFFVDGLTEDLITALSAWRTFPVIARNSTFAYKGKSPDVRKVAEELNVRYVLEGSVRKSATRVRVNAQLIEAQTGHHIWAEKFDREIEDIFDVQDEITNYLASIVEPEIGKSEQRRLTPARPASLQAWELYQRGMALMDNFTLDDNRRAREHFEQAHELDPQYAPAVTGLAYTYHRDIWSGYTKSREASIDSMISTAKQAVALDDGDSMAHCLLGFGYMWSRRFNLAIAEGERAVALNPSNHVALAQLGLALCYDGAPLQGLPMFDRSIKVNPRSQRVHFVISCLARAHLNARDPEAAAAAAKQALTHEADYPLALLILASALGHVGDREGAERALRACQNRQPGFASQWAATPMYRKRDDDLYFLEGLWQAGLDPSVQLADVVWPEPV